MNRLNLSMLALALVGCTCSHAFADRMTKKNLRGKWNSNRAVVIKAGDNKLEITFADGSSTEDCVAHILSFSGQMGFTITNPTGNQIKVKHADKPSMQLVGVQHNALGTPIGPDDAAFESRMILQLTGQPTGIGSVNLTIDDVNVSYDPLVGDTLFDIVAALDDAIAELFPDDPGASFGVAYESDFIDGPPTGSVDLAFWELSGKDIFDVEATSTDPGVFVEVSVPAPVTMAILMTGCTCALRRRRG